MTATLPPFDRVLDAAEYALKQQVALTAQFVSALEKYKSSGTGLAKLEMDLLGLQANYWSALADRLEEYARGRLDMVEKNGKFSH